MINLMELPPQVAAALPGALAGFLPGRRWFGAKDRELLSAKLWDAAPLAPGHFLALVEVTLAGGAPPALYQVPLIAGAGGELDLDAMAKPSHRHLWLQSLINAATFAGSSGHFGFELFDSGNRSAEARRLASGDSIISSAEQSNTTVLFRDSEGVPVWILKLFRRLQPGPNPDLDIPLALFRDTAFTGVPRAVGVLHYRDEYVLAAAHQFLSNQGDGWQFVTARLRSDPSASALLDEVGLLGRCTAKLHLALASVADPDFEPEPITGDDVAAWRAGAEAGATALRSYLPRALNFGGLESLTAGVHKIRVHGDYHLGQVLKTESGFAIFDFEGEPTRRLPERRRKLCALKDVAGMLRSIGYAAHVAGSPEWETNARRIFWEGYRGAIGGAAVPLIPPGAAQAEAALAFFEREKAVYELDYELRHRPDWVGIPLRALRRL